jgi:hypothetical protein
MHCILLVAQGFKRGEQVVAEVTIVATEQAQPRWLIYRTSP